MKGRSKVNIVKMKYIMNLVNPGNNFTKRLTDILAKYPNIDHNALGIKPNWQAEPLWVS